MINQNVCLDFQTSLPMLKIVKHYLFLEYFKVLKFFPNILNFFFCSKARRWTKEGKENTTTIIQKFTNRYYWLALLWRLLLFHSSCSRYLIHEKKRLKQALLNLRIKMSTTSQFGRYPWENVWRGVLFWGAVFLVHWYWKQWCKKKSLPVPLPTRPKIHQRVTWRRLYSDKMIQS